MTSTLPECPCRIRISTCGTASTSGGVAPRSKKSLRVKPNMPANSAAGICWMPVVIFLDRVVEEAAAGRNLVLEVGQFARQLLEVGVGLEVRIGFPDSAISLPECARLNWFSANRDLSRSLRRHRGVAGLDNPPRACRVRARRSPSRSPADWGSGRGAA